MTFKTRKISRRRRRKLLFKMKRSIQSFFGFLKNMPSKTKNYVAAGVLVLFGIFVVIKVMGAAYGFVSDFNPKELIFAVGSDLEKDEHGYTNILLLGDGGHERDGADLIDTIMVASIDYEKNSVSLLSIPRDFYVESSESAMQWPGRINELYRNHKNQMSEDERFELFKDVTGEIVGLDIQYFLRVDFKAFVEVVDSLGGVTVDVENAIYDPYYPNESDNGYVLFKVDEGLQEMNGETALKFVRSRKTTSDFDRAARQQLVIESIQQKALSKDILTSPKTLKDVYAAVDKNVNTDMTLREMIALAGFAKHLDRSRLVRKVIHDDPGQEGGFLYTPERELYNGQFVLIPFGNDYELIHKYSNLIFHQREVYYDPASIEVLNATKYPGVARNAAYQLNRFGFNVIKIDNYFDNSGEKEYLENSLMEYHDYTQKKDGLVLPRYETTINALDGFVKAKDVASNTAYLLSEDKNEKVYENSGINLSIVMGEDYDVFLVK